MPKVLSPRPHALNHNSLPVDGALGVRLIKLVPGLAPRIAAALKISPAAVYGWNEVPIARVLEVEKASGLRRELLRPDLFLT